MRTCPISLASAAAHGRRCAVALICALSFAYAPPPALAQFKQQGAKLVPNDAVSTPQFGASVAAAVDNSTILIGGPTDKGPVGAAWVFIRSNGVWVQQGPKLVGADYVAPGAEQGGSVALSADGNTALIGGSDDNGNIGAAWVFTRSNGVWTQQGPKLVGSGYAGQPEQGSSVALSSDGNTAIIGGPDDNSITGAAWVFTRSGGVWTQQGQKLVGTGATGPIPPRQGVSVSLSSDGNTAIVGATDDNATDGAAWIFTRSGGAWTQQGSKLVGGGAVGHASQGWSVALAGEGDIALIGGLEDDSGRGAAWVFEQSGGVWTLQPPKLTGNQDSLGQYIFFGGSVAMPFSGHFAAVGGSADASETGAAWVFTPQYGGWYQSQPKLVGTGASGAAKQGSSVATSPGGSTILSGGPYDNSYVGAVWVFVSHSNAATHDFFGDGMSDILWRSTSGDLVTWRMNGAQVQASTAVANVPTSWTVAGQRDFDGDTDADVLWRDTSGNVAIWLMHGTTVASSTLVGNVSTTWSIAGTGDFNGDGKADILWRDTSGNLAIWLMDGGTITSSVLVANVPTTWSVAGCSGKTILWRDTSGNNALWRMNGGTVTSSVSLGNVPTSWSIAGTGDFDGDGNIDILWRDTAGNGAMWLLDGNGAVTLSGSLGNVPTNWSVAQTGDYYGLGKSQILWRDTSGNVALWFMNGATVGLSTLVANVPTSWAIQGAGVD